MSPFIAHVTQGCSMIQVRQWVRFSQSCNKRTQFLMGRVHTLHYWISEWRVSLAVSDRSKIPLTCDISRVVYTWIIDVNQGIRLPRREPAILPEFSLAERMAAMGATSSLSYMELSGQFREQLRKQVPFNYCSGMLPKVVCVGTVLEIRPVESGERALVYSEATKLVNRERVKGESLKVELYVNVPKAFDLNGVV